MLHRLLGRFSSLQIMMNPPCRRCCRSWSQLLGAITTFSMLAIAGTAAGLLGWLFYSLDTPIGVTVVKDFLLQINGDHHFTVLSPATGLPVIRGTIGTSLRSRSLNLRSSNEVSAHLLVSDVDLRISLEIEETVQIYTIQWHNNGINHTLEDCFSLLDALWFAGSSEFKEPWPVSDTEIDKAPFLPSVGVYERFWLSSNGLAVTVPSNFPVQFSFNSSGSNRLCFQSHSHDISQKFKLKYRIVVGADIKHVHAYILSSLPKPLDMPPITMITKPTWSVFADHGKSLQLEMYTKHILSNGFNGSLLLFSHDYIQNYIEYQHSYSRKHKQEKDSLDTKLYGEWFKSFENELGYVKRRGICPTVTISLRISLNGLEMKPNIGIFGSERFNIRHSDKKRFHAMISAIQEIKICNVALEIKVDPDIRSVLTFQQTPISRNLHFIRGMVNHTTAEFAQTLLTWNAACPWMNHFIRMDDRSPEWDAVGSILSEAFSLGIAGYPFLMAPGLSLQNTTSSHRKPMDAELYIRWMQLVALFPAVHINIPPWHFPPDVIHLVHEILRFRNRFVPIILEAARSTVHSGLPIVRPMWMVESTTDPAVLSINDQFSISQDIVVAPVLKKNARSRHIYLPSGDWLDTLHSKTLAGPQWLHNYTVTLEQLPIFTRLKERNDD